MNTKVNVVDYGMGNVRSVCRAFEQCGADVEISDDPTKIASADRVVLPGVGAISHCFEELRERRLVDPLTRFVESEKPFLGICVGMQVMMDVSWEFRKSDCLGWISGEVSQVSKFDANGDPHKIPHIGWSKLDHPSTEMNWDNTILQGIDETDSVYFVHSYGVEPVDEKVRLANTSYNGIDICAAVSDGLLCGTQFHPEKSGKVGLKIIQNFLSL
jgi:imidazole glycerol-phosphate synthase subunit HisH